MRHVVRIVSISIVLVALLALVATQAYAQEPTGTPEAAPTATPVSTSLPPATGAPDESDGSRVSLGLLGFQERVLRRSPSDSTTYVFGLPAEWELTEGAEIQLNIAGFLTGVAPPRVDNGVLTNRDDVYFSLLELYFNGQLLDTISINLTRDTVVTASIPSEALISQREDGRHVLYIRMDTGLECGANAGLAIRSDSFFTLPHDLKAPPTDLRHLPYPIVQRSFPPDEVVVVVPDDPTSSDIQAALNVVAGFGKSSDNSLALVLVPVGQLTDALRESRHVIFVGKPDAFAMLDEVNLPLPVGQSGFQASDRNADDGVLQMAVSPWNATKVVLVVSGDTDAALVKAAQAASSNRIRTSVEQNLALIAEVHEANRDDPTLLLNQTFAQSGYETRILDEVGYNMTTYHFQIPSAQLVDADAVLNLIVSHSTLLDYERSGLVVWLNGEPVGSVRLTDENAQLGSVRIGLPASLLQTGNNDLVMEAQLRPYSECYDPDATGAWLTIQADSSLTIPIAPSVGIVAEQVIELSTYPNPFTINSELSDTAFVLPPDNPTAWDTAAQLALHLGDNAEGETLSINAVFADDIPEDIRDGYNLILVGRPSALPLIMELGDLLPAPFEKGSDNALERNMQVVYRLPPGKTVGYLEMLASPWNAERVILAVLGTTDQGVQWAAKALTVPELRRSLFGNFAAVDGDQVVSAGNQQADDTESTVATPASESTSQTPPVVAQGTPEWILPALQVTGALIVIIILFVALSSLWRWYKARSRQQRGKS